MKHKDTLPSDSPMYGHHSFNLQPLLHNHQSYWCVLTGPVYLSLSVSMLGKYGVTNLLHVRGSVVQRTGIGCRLIFGSCRGQTQLGIVRSCEILSLWEHIHVVLRSSGYQFIHGV